jgi:glutamate carboxypeptidase
MKLLPQTLREHFVDRQEAVLDLTARLVGIESPSGDEEGSRAAVELLSEFAQTIPTAKTIERIPCSGYGVHLLIRFFKGTSEGATLLLGHTDTVYPRGTLATQPLRREGSQVFGPGIFDMKANCVLALEALRALALHDVAPAHEVVLLLTCDEETGSYLSRGLIEHEARRAANVLVLEPSAPGGSVKTARKGTGMWTLHAHGRAAHAGLNPEAGASAIREMARQIERLYDLGDAARGTTINVGCIEGGTRSNVVAEEARAELDVRFSTMAEAHRIEESLKSLTSFDERVRLTIEGGVNRPPLERTPKVMHLYKRARSIATELDFELGEAAVGGASDGNFVAALGCPVLDGLGVEGDGAHAAHEHIVTTNIARRGALLASLIAIL